MSKIIGNTVGMGLPKPNLKQTDPTKGDYVKGKDAYAKVEDIPTKPEDIGAQPKGNYLTAVPDGYATEEFVRNKIAEAELAGGDVDLSGYAQKSEIPTKTSQLTNDSGFMTKVPEGYAKTADIPTNPEDIGAQPAGSYLTEETDPTVPNWAKQPKKPTYTASEVGARSADWMPTAQEVGALPSTTVIPTVPTKVSAFTNDAGYLTEHQDISGKLDADKLPQAVEDALAQAKASGEFDGEDGYTPVKGKDYKDGADGVSPTVAVSAITGGHRITITDKNGTKTVDVMDGEDGDPGDPGKTPVRGEDYWTDADKAEIEAYIATELAKRGQIKPEFAQSMEWLEANGDTSKLYVLPDNLIYANVEATTTGPAYTNILDTATVTLNKRWSHSSKALSDSAGHVAISYFPVKCGDVIRVNLPLTTENFSKDYNRYHYFDANKNYVAGHLDGAIDVITAMAAESESVTSWVVGYECTTNNNDSTSVKISGADDIAYMNLILNRSSTTITEADIAGLVVTVNQPIEETTVTGRAWRSTGHAFVPADYEDRIIATEEQVAENTTKIAALEKAVETGGVDDNLAAAYTRIKEWRYPIHEDAPVFLLDADKPAIADSERNTAAVYAKYDTLMAENPGFITREDCGMASDGTTPIYVYHFKEADPHYASKVWSETKPVLLICSGVHPTEQTGVHSLYHAMAEITMNPKLRDLRRNVHFIVMPMINPTAFSDSTWGVRNPDGIQVHYNFEVDFKYPADAGYVANGNRNHGGETPLSIPETQYFDALMQEYQDTLACVISCHNNDVDVNRGTGYIWCSCATHAMCNLGFRFVDKMSEAWREKYGDAFDEGVRWANEYAITKAAQGSSLFDPNYVYEQPEWDHRVGMASLSGSGGTEYKQALKYGVHGINVETCDRCMILDKDFGKARTANVVTMGTETYINFFRTFMAFYNPLLKKEYAPNLPWEG